MQKDFQFWETVKKQGVTERTVSPYNLPKKARSNQYTRNLWSFRLRDGNTYAYFGQMFFDKLQYYHFLSVENDAALDMLDFWDRLEEKTERQSTDNISYEHLSYIASIDEDGSAVDPMDREEYMRWVQQENSSEDLRIPIKAEHAIVHSIIERLSPADRRVFRYMFEGNYSDAEIKQVFELEHSAWSNEKKRFLEKVRQIFIELGYDVPTLDEVKEQEKKRNDHMALVEKAKAEAAAIDALGRSISREIKRSESTTKSRAYASEEQAEHDARSGLYEMLYEEDAPVSK